MSEKPEWLTGRTDEQLEAMAQYISKALQYAEQVRAAAVGSIKACDEALILEALDEAVALRVRVERTSRLLQAAWRALE